ncbi:MAG: hypothetical protein DRJ42_14970 [Deltaproteobacteria bacterium]|nr:MAG: hypothetical protein DRJ42_14970 [Deltaproteobacteria bacterium]
MLRHLRPLLIPLLLAVLVISLPGCSLDTSAIVGDSCPESDAAAICNGAGTHLLSCADGAPTTESCAFGCTPRAESCWVCDPGTRRCDGDVILTCETTGDEIPAATCTAGTCSDDGMGGAGCGACLPGTSRCDDAGEAIIACDATGMEDAPVPCGMGEHCEPGGGGTTGSCVLACVETCDGDDRVTCAGGEVREACPLGCDPTSIECRVLVPSNVGGSVALDSGTSGLAVGVTAPEVLIFDTDDGGRIDRYNPATGERTLVRMSASGSVDAGIYHEQRGGEGSETPSGAEIPDLAVWVMDSLTVGAMGTIHFVGTRAAVVLVEGDVLVEGRINARAEWLLDTDGAEVFVHAPAGGGGFEGTDGEGFGGGGEGNADSSRRGGGGGGSYGSPGGQGGSAGRGGTPGDPGPVYGDEGLVPLYGGSAGGAGADEIAAGGDGGGALQISAGGTLTVTTSAIIDASGEGGYGASGNRGGGGGGGAGGSVLLEAAAISIAGTVGAPGGGGGGGTQADPDGSPGSRWDPPSELRGLRGAGSGMHGGRGGRGSAEDGRRGANGEDKDDPNGGGGGGGGGAGRIRLNVRPGAMPTVTGTLVPSGALSSEGEVGVL